MRALFTFIKKEFTEHLRSGRLIIIGLLFILVGVMNPAIAKLTPLLMEIMADSLSESGLIITEVNVSAMDSWVQFYKNMPMALIAFILIESNIFTKEYQSGTLVLSLTKGLSRDKVVISKTIVLLFLWSIGYWLCFLITYTYNAYFWDNSVANHLMFSVMCFWIFGMMVVLLMVFFSALVTSNTDVLLGTGSAVLASYLVGLLPKWKNYLPTHLIDGNSLIYGFVEAQTYIPSLLIAMAIGVICLVITILIFNKKAL